MPDDRMWTEPKSAYSFLFRPRPFLANKWEPVPSRTAEEHRLSGAAATELRRKEKKKGREIRRRVEQGQGHGLPKQACSRPYGSGESLGAIDFVERGTNSVVFRTCCEERDRVVFQMGTANAVRALTAAQIVCKDVAAIDINMGCPKSFSISGGMGAALLSNPELIHDILTTLRRNLDTVVTCKIRLLNSSQDTIELARRIEKTGVSALALHGRRVKDRPRDPAKWNEIADVVASLSIPVIANGDVFEYEDFGRIKDATGASSVMVARGALWNASIFCAKGKSSWEDVKREYVRKCILWDNDIKSTKHTLKEMITHYSSLELAEGKAVIKSETTADLATIYGEAEYYHFVTSNRP